MKFLLPFLFILALPLRTLPQTSGSFATDMNFTTYLLKNNEYKDALLFLHSIKNNLTSQQSDSVYYQIGLCYYLKKSLDTSTAYFDSVSSHSVLYVKSNFFSLFNETYSGHYQSASQYISKLDNLSDSLSLEYRWYIENAILLLTRDTRKFDTTVKKLSYRYFQLQEEEKNLSTYRFQLDSVKRRSPVIAGILSALVPGAGRFYAGRPGQGISSMFTVFPLAAMATESLLKAGPSSWNFIITGGLFSIFYFGNIWGSALSVKVKKNERYRKIDEDIKYDLHVAFRRIFLQ